MTDPTIDTTTIDRVLEVITAFDRRTIGQVDFDAWTLVLHGLSQRDCIQAVIEHHRESTDYLMPAHVVARARAIRADRAARRGPAIEAVQEESTPEGRAQARRLFEELRRRNRNGNGEGDAA